MCTRRKWKLNVKAREENKKEVFFYYYYYYYFPRNIYFNHAKRRNIADITAEETVDTDSPKHILKRLENSEKRLQEKLDKIVETFISMILQA